MSAESVACPSNRDGHCWHASGHVLTSLPPQQPEVCCWCGGARLVTAQRTTQKKHGPHLGVQRSAIALPNDGMGP